MNEEVVKTLISTFINANAEVMPASSDNPGKYVRFRIGPGLTVTIGTATFVPDGSLFIGFTNVTIPVVNSKRIALTHFSVINNSEQYDQLQFEPRSYRFEPFLFYTAPFTVPIPKNDNVALVYKETNDGQERTLQYIIVEEM